MTKRKILICSAWPYANGSLHLGHIAALLPADILARYFRLQGEDVLFVSGSDCHGTPITVKANQDGRDPRDVAGQYHREFVDSFAQLGFSFDRYTATYDAEHQRQVQEIIRRLYETNWLYPKEVQQYWCDHCNKFLPDRYVEGICPHCGAKDARGDQCDSCGRLLDPNDLGDLHCKLCGHGPKLKPSQHLYFKLSQLQKGIEALVAKNEHFWRVNARKATQRYLEEGLHDRAISRDIDWGIPVPIDGYRDKRVYVWFEAVMGYLTTSKRWAQEKGCPDAWQEFWSQDATSYYVHGKDNIPFHTVILPGLLIALDDSLNLPNRVISSEFLNIEGKKLSTSKNWAVWIPDFLANYPADSIRYFLTANSPESRDGDFSWREFVERNNGELAGAWGNLVNRTLSFIERYFENRIPPRIEADSSLLTGIKSLYQEVGNLIEAGQLKESLKLIFEHVRAANKYFDSQAPWQTIKTDRKSCENAINTCVQAIANIAVLTAPFLPFATTKIFQCLGLSQVSWCPQDLPSGGQVKKPDILFPNLDKDVIDKELAKLGK